MDKLMMGAARIRANRLHRISALPGGDRHSFSQNLCAGFIDIERIRSVRRLQGARTRANRPRLAHTCAPPATLDCKGTLGTLPTS